MYIYIYVYRIFVCIFLYIDTNNTNTYVAETKIICEVSPGLGKLQLKTFQNVF